MLSKLTRKNQTDRSLDFTRRDGGFLGVSGKLCVAKNVDETAVASRTSVTY